ncbi:hypothetical protein HO173_012063 [Letharia columbiana]|uniref:Uncharacterized protein n=1 Tax=Letharia columbiana TaxID=112416 RepID=A0A8H6FH66_9LECA|nr:uncharacterized protein HO173_012063 [Letharia columbiana]KAF6227733.1 hypothetical protein HO173_012063 [Letharia columbiana]
MYAVQYAAPARHTLRILLDNAYRTGNAADFDAQKITNTVTFLEGAAREKGLEHRVLKSLLHTWFWSVNSGKYRKSLSLKTANTRTEQSQAAIQHFEITLKMLNESMGMCLPTTFTTKRESPGID